MLVDRFGRVHRSLRISVTDRCNLRCTYCMPEHTPDYQPRSEILTFEEIERFTRVAVSLGVDDVRLTGGEPLVRSQLHRLVGSLSRIEGLGKIALTTNGVLLADQVEELFAAGLRYVNVSLDALDAASFQTTTRRDELDRVLCGINAAHEIGMRVKINSIAMRGLTEHQITAFGEFTRRTDIPIRFIEFMPLDSDGQWDETSVFSAKEILRRFADHFGPLKPVAANTSSPSKDYEFADGHGRVGVIASVTEPFCHSCDRFRITADGQLRNCLFGEDNGDVRALLRTSEDDQPIRDLIVAAITAKRAGHGTDDLTFLRPSRPMHAIGG
ncbi:GTP 3',8-cyclase MoaA [Neorhodopirellula pilleata]|nr:GTP 3',8-cyclase MoaA [Neorhodopirellula pilleata]